MSLNIMNTTIQSKTKQKSDLKKSLNYIFLVLIISWTVGFTTYNLLDSSSGIIIRAIAELSIAIMPALLAIIINKREGGNWKSLNFFKPSVKGIFLAILIPLGYVSIDFFIQISLGFRTSPDWSILGTFPKNAAILLFGYLAMTILVMGEEIGWRGYLQDKLFNSYGKFKGVFILGSVWGIWHLPAALQGYNFQHYPYIEAFITYPLICIASSIIIAYVGFNKHSIFIAALFHAANNHFKVTVLSTTKVIDNFNFMLISNFICIDLILIFGFLYWRRIKKQKQLEK